jgi:hypothetical protein
MLAKCSNLSCSAPFRHLQDGTMALRISKEENVVPVASQAPIHIVLLWGMISISLEQQEG